MAGYSGTAVCQNCKGTFAFTNYDCVPTLCKDCYGARKVADYKVSGGLSGIARCQQCGGTFCYSDYKLIPSLCFECFVNKKMARHAAG